MTETDAEWAASLTVQDVDLLINRCVKAKDMRGVGAALHLMAVKDPDRADLWRTALSVAVEIGLSANDIAQGVDNTAATSDAPRQNDPTRQPADG